MERYEISSEDRPSLEALAQLLSAAFNDDPWLQKLFKEDTLSKSLFFMFVLKLTVAMGGSIWYYRHEGQLAGVACLEHPSTKGSFKAQVLAFTSLMHLLSRSGLSTFKLMNEYMRLTSKHRPKANHHYLLCIGVAPDIKGKGIGKQMLEVINTLVDEDPSSTGIGLDTENVNNIGLYEHFGYQHTGTEDLEGMSIYSFFK